MSENSTEVKKEQSHVFDSYDLKVHRWGRISMFLAMTTMFLPLIGVSMRYDVAMDWKAAGVATLAILAAYGVNGLIEPFTFAPILGAGATYIAFTTGNVAGTKVPCVVSAQDIMGVEMGTKEGDVVATLAVGACSLVTTLEVALGMVFVNLIYPVLTSETLKPGFDNIMPALMGAMTVQRVLKSPKVAAVPYTLAILIFLIMGRAWGMANGVWIMLALIVLTVVWARFLYNRGKV
ncbi:MAG: hypothetical protein ACLTKI_00650 [Lachnospiraceae bacterium]